MSLRGITVISAALVLAMSMTVGGTASAVDLPCKTARVVVPFGAGGGSDILARIIVDGANRLGAKPQLQVVNITGQGGTLGSKEVARAKPDGCTMLFTHRSILAAYLTGHANFAWDAYQPLSMLVTESVIFAAHPDAPFNSLKELQAYAKANPGTVKFAASLGSNTHFMLLVLQDRLDMDVKIVGYEGGRERMTALLAHNVDVGQVGESDAQQYLKSGQLKSLVMFSEKRSPRLPDMSTAKEQGFDLLLGVPRGMMAPEGTPQPIVDYYVDLFKKTVADPQVVQQLEAKGNQVTFMPAAEYSKWWADNLADWERLAKKINIYRVKK